MVRVLPLLLAEELERSPSLFLDGEAGFGSMRSLEGLFPLRGLEVRAHIVGLTGLVTMDQRFVNAFSTRLEGTYIFPLPSRAAVITFILKVGNRVVRGIIQERSKARAEYEAAVEAGHRAAIAEEERPGVFTVRCGNVAPGEEARVVLQLAMPLPYTDGDITFRFPLVIAPRYIPGQPLSRMPPAGDGVAADTDQVPDASRISPPVLLPGFKNPINLRLEVDIEPFNGSPIDISQARCSLHTVVLQGAEAEPWAPHIAQTSARDGLRRRATSDHQEADHQALFLTESSAAEGPEGGTLRLILDPERSHEPECDFVLRIRLPRCDHLEPGAALIVHDDGEHEPSSGGNAISAEGTWQLALVPPAEDAGGVSVRRRDIVFVLDRSGSMSGWRITAARAAICRMLETLDGRDRFALLAFDNTVEFPSLSGAATTTSRKFWRHDGGGSEAVPGPALVVASDALKYRALQWLLKVNARGGTEMAEPLVQAATMMQASCREEEDGVAGAPRDKILVVVTDGQVGDEAGIINQLSSVLEEPLTNGPEPHGRNRTRVFTLGIDQTVNEGFLKRLAGLTSDGACELVESQERLNDAMDLIHRRICTPFLTNLRITYAGGPFELFNGDSSPSRLPGLFPGTPLIVAGRYKRTAKQDDTGGALVLDIGGRAANGRPWCVRVGSRPTGAGWQAVQALWARALIRDLEDVYECRTLSGPESLRLEERMTEISTRFGVLCRFTAFTAIDYEEKLGEGLLAQPLDRITVPVSRKRNPGGGGTARAHKEYAGQVRAASPEIALRAGRTLQRGGRGCFPPDAAILMASTAGGQSALEPARMDEVMLGSHVLALDPVMMAVNVERVHWMTYRRPKVKATFVVLETSSGHNLTLTAGHYLFASKGSQQNDAPVLSGSRSLEVARAGDLRVGDIVWVLSSAGTNAALVDTAGPSPRPCSVPSLAHRTAQRPGACLDGLQAEAGDASADGPSMLAGQTPLVQGALDLKSGLLLVPTTIVRISSVVKTGLYSAWTGSGTLVVDGVAVLAFSDRLPPSLTAFRCVDALPWAIGTWLPRLLAKAVNDVCLASASAVGATSSSVRRAWSQKGGNTRRARARRRLVVPSEREGDD